jgi:hypothetical protein
VSKRPGDPGYAAGWCVHYRSPVGGAGRPDHDTCEAGVAYDTFKTGDFKTRFAQQPCFLTEKGKSRPGALPCPNLRRPTPEEIAAHEAWVNQRLNMMRIVMPAILPWRKQHKGRNHAETIDCPACKTGKLALSIAASNGHVHGQCSTPGCVSWME